MDKYDEEIAELTAHPGEILDHWYASSPLFQFAGSGCLTMIRDRDRYRCDLPDLTEEIRRDVRIPTSGRNITVEHLPVFAEWQRRLDRELPSRQKQKETAQK